MNTGETRTSPRDVRRIPVGEAMAYPRTHWLRSPDPEAVVQAARRQAALTYSRVKTAFLFDLLGDLKGRTLLDYGCGAGCFAVQALERGAGRVVGLDAGPEALAGAALLARRRGVADRLDLTAALAPVFSGRARFDAICLRDVLEHMPDDQGLLNALAGLLAPGGRLVLATQNAWSLNFLLEGGVRRLILGQRDWMGWDPTHLRFYTPARLRVLVERAGLRVRGYRGAYVLPHKIPNPFPGGRAFWRVEPLAALDRTLGRIFPTDRLGWSLMMGAS